MFKYLMYIFEVQMCMFGYLKTPDIILPLVSSRKLDWTHTFDTHCMLSCGDMFQRSQMICSNVFKLSGRYVKVRMQCICVHVVYSVVDL